MSRKFLTHLDMAKNELQNAVMQNLGADPSSPVKGQIYFNSTSNTMFWYNGTAWVAASPGTGFPGYGAVAPEPTFGSASADGVGTTVARADHKHGNPVHDNAAHSAVTLNSLAAPTANVSMGGFKITNLANGTAANEAVNLSQLDSVAAGLDAKQSVRMATTVQYTLSGLGVAVDGITPVANDRVLVKNQTSAAQNGIWLANAAGWTRAADMDVWSEVPGAFVFVEEGATQADTGWVSTADSVGTIASTNMPWTQFSGGGALIAGNGLDNTGNTWFVGAGTGITVGANDVAVNFVASGGDNGTATTAARSDHDHDTLYPPVGRLISTTAPLTGGGDLSANRTLAITSFAGSAAGAVPVSVGGTVNFLRADGSWSPPPLDTTAGDNRYSRKFTQGTSAATTTTVNHSLGTRDVVVEVFRNSTPWDTVDCDVERTDTNNVTCRFVVATTANEYRIVIHG